MILCHQHRFIFLKTRKTAGTSIEIALSRICGPDDIITTIMPEDEELRRKTNGRGPQNTSVGFRHYRIRDWLRLLIRRKPLHFYNHIPAATVKRWIGDEIWNAYHKFCVERNPFDQAISRYYWKTRDLSVKPPLLQVLQSIPPEIFSNWMIYSINDRIAVDQIIQYASLADEFPRLLQQLGIEQKIDLPFSKSGYRNKQDSPALLEMASREWIERICAREIATFGYKCD